MTTGHMIQGSSRSIEGSHHDYLADSACECSCSLEIIHGNSQVFNFKHDLDVFLAAANLVKA